MIFKESGEKKLFSRKEERKKLIFNEKNSFSMTKIHFRFKKKRNHFRRIDTLLRDSTGVNHHANDKKNECRKIPLYHDGLYKY